MHSLKSLSEAAIFAAEEAGQVLRGFFRAPDLVIDRKSDNSVVTEADHASDRRIDEILRKAFPDIPIISEETALAPPPEEEQTSQHHPPASPDGLRWVVDPLDGTRSFIKGRSDYAVCIALLKDNYPCLGVLNLPNSMQTYYGYGNTAEVIEKGVRRPIHAKSEGKVLSVNRSIPVPKGVAEEYEIVRQSAAGKFGLVAEGSASLYLRFGPTYEWDTAAGQAIVEAAGGQVLVLNGSDEGQRLSYLKNEYINPPFVALCPSEEENWQGMAEAFRADYDLYRKKN